MKAWYYYGDKFCIIRQKNKFAIQYAKKINDKLGY